MDSFLLSGKLRTAARNGRRGQKALQQFGGMEISRFDRNRTLPLLVQYGKTLLGHENNGASLRRVCVQISTATPTQGQSFK